MALVGVEGGDAAGRPVQVTRTFKGTKRQELSALAKFVPDVESGHSPFYILSVEPDSAEPLKPSSRITTPHRPRRHRPRASGAASRRPSSAINPEDAAVEAAPEDLG